MKKVSSGRTTARSINHNLPFFTSIASCRKRRERTVGTVSIATRPALKLENGDVTPMGTVGTANTWDRHQNAVFRLTPFCSVLFHPLRLVFCRKAPDTDDLRRIWGSTIGEKIWPDGADFGTGRIGKIEGMRVLRPKMVGTSLVGQIEIFFFLSRKRAGWDRVCPLEVSGFSMP